MMTPGLRMRLLLAVVPPFVALAAAAGFDAPPAIVAACGLVAAGLTGLAVVALTTPFDRARAFALDAAAQAGLAAPGTSAPPAGTSDGTGDVAWAVAALADELAAVRRELAVRDGQFRATLADAASVLNAAARDSRLPARAARPGSPWVADNAAFAAAVGNAAEAIGAGYRKASGLQAVLHDIPDPVVVLDAKLAAIFVNAAAEDWFAHLPSGGLKQPLASFLAAALPPDPAEADTASTAGPDDAVAWATSGRGGSLEATAATTDGPTPVVLSALATRQRRAGGWLVLTARDLTATKKVEANVRALHRRLTGQRMSLLVAREAGPALETIRTQAGLLAQAAKQAGHRERFVPKIQRILEEVDRQKLVVDQLGWLGRLSTTTASEPDAQEVHLRAVADDVVEKLTPAFAERGNSIDLSGDAGWLIADEDRVTTVISGILLHANQSCEQVCVYVALGRRTSVSTADELSEVVVRYSGPGVTAAHVADVRDPFRRPNSGVTDSSGKTGFLLGLAVSNKVAALMGGALDIDGTGGVVTLRVVVPSRARTDNRAAARVAVGPGEAGADARDALGDFFVGGGRPAAESVTDTPAPVTVPDSFAGGPADLAGGDTLGSFFGPG